MIKKFAVISVSLLALLAAAEFVYDYDFSAPVFSQKEAHLLMEVENCMLQGIEGEPLLPHRAFSILLPPGESLESVEVSILAKKSYPLMLPLLPKQADRPLSHGRSGKFMKKESIYSKNEYRSEKIRAQVQYFGGAAVVTGALIPVSYFPAKGMVDLNTKLSLKVKTNSSNQDIHLDAGLLKQLEVMVDNPDMLASYSVPDQDERERMLIISSSTYESVFDTLIEHYSHYGIEANFMSVNDISTNYSGVDLQEKIRNAIKEYYIVNDLDYVLLGGNIMIVPARGLSCRVLSGGSWISSDNIPSDLYYAALDGTWDTNLNGVYGEYNDTTGFDEADLIPELAIGRFPANTLDEMKNMINKSLLYQQSPIVDEMDKHVFFGEFLWGDPETWAADYMELLIGSRNDNGYTTVGLSENLTINKWYDQDSLGLWSELTVKEELASGYSFLHHDGHANYSYMMKFDLSEVNDSDFVTVNGIDHTTPVFYSHGCSCGGFDRIDCIAKKIVTSPYISVGGIFNSRYGWFNEGQTEGPSIHIHREFEDAIYGHHYNQLGRALSLSRGATAPWVTAMGQHEQNALRWNFYTINVLGDPAMRIYSQKPVLPEVLYDISQLHLGHLSAIIKKDDIVMADAGLAIVDTSGQLVGFALSDARGIASIELDQAPIDGEVLHFYVSGENLLLSDTTIVSRESSIDIVDSHVLLTAYPNPFNPSVAISYNIPSMMNVTVKLYDVNGRVVDVLAEGQHIAGNYQLDYHAGTLSSGLYICRIESENIEHTVSRKLLLLK